MTRIEVRRDTAANWTSENTVLAGGEFGLETDTGNLKIGDGSLAWTDLGYLNSGGGGAPSLPVADVTGITIDTTTYNNPATGGPDKIAVLVFPAAPPGGAQVVYGVAVEGDAFPRELHFADPISAGVDFGDGTTDPWNQQSFGWAGDRNDDNSYEFDFIAAVGLTLGTQDPNYVHQARFSGGALVLGLGGTGDAGAGLISGIGAPTCGGYVGDVYIDKNGGDGAWLYRCTTEGAAGVAVWAAKL